MHKDESVEKKYRVRVFCPHKVGKRCDSPNRRSSTELAISTSLIHSIASVGNFEQEQTSVLNLIFQHENVCGEGNLSKMKFGDLKSLLVCHIILKMSSLRGVE